MISALIFVSKTGLIGQKLFQNKKVYNSGTKNGVFRKGSPIIFFNMLYYE